MSDSGKLQEASTSMGLELFLFLKIKNKNVRQLFLDVPFLSAPCPDIVTMYKFLLGSHSLPAGAYLHVLRVLQISTEVVWQPSSVLGLKPSQGLVFTEW